MYHRLSGELISCDDENIANVGIQFLPLAAIDEAITAEIDAASVRRHWYSRKTWHDQAKDYRGGQSGEQKRRVIALLGLCDQEKAIQGLLDEGLRDHHLPLSRPKVKGPSSTLISHQKNQKKVFNSFSSWKDRDIDSFLNRQQEVLAPEFTTRGEHIDIDVDIKGVIPLPVYDIKRISVTITSTVYKARLHAAHLMPRTQHSPHIAIKSYFKKEDFEKEKGNLRQTQALNHPHLIQHIATVKQGKKGFYAILDWADGGNLCDFWAKHPNASQTRSSELFKWCFQQMLGLVEALFALHKADYRHGDLKPENILHFKDRDDPDILRSKYGRLVITDVGISKFHSQATDLRQKGTDTKASTLCYEAPEAELDLKPPGQGKPRSRRYDMWSVGCIYMEFIIWWLYGYKTIGAFTKIREVAKDKAPYYKCINGHAEIHPAVSSGLDALSKDPRCAKGTGLADLINLIKRDLIVVDPKKRAKAEELRDKFIEISQKANDGLLAKRVQPPPGIPAAFTSG